MTFAHSRTTLIFSGQLAALLINSIDKNFVPCDISAKTLHVHLQSFTILLFVYDTGMTVHIQIQ